MNSVCAVVVSFADPRATARAVKSLRGQTVPPDEVVVVDNGGNVGSQSLEARVLEPGRNLGYAAGANLGAQDTVCDWIFFLNPDAVADPVAIEKLLECAGEGVGAVGCQVLLPDGRVNAGDNPVHLTGLAWSGHFSEQAEGGPPREPSSLSGAGLMVRAAAWRQAGGLDPGYFLYHDDVDLCLRLRLAGWKLAYQPAALVVHDYEFMGSPEKYFFLERNRLWTMLSVFSARTLALLFPLLVATEVALVARSLREGWFREKARALAAVVSSRRRLARRRAEVQATRRVPDRDLLSHMVAAVDTPLAATSAGRRSGPLLEAYRRLLMRISR